MDLSKPIKSQLEYIIEKDKSLQAEQENLSERIKQFELKVLELKREHEKKILDWLNEDYLHLASPHPNLSYLYGWDIQGGNGTGVYVQAYMNRSPAINFEVWDDIDLGLFTDVCKSLRKYDAAKLSVQKPSGILKIPIILGIQLYHSMRANRLLQVAEENGAKSYNSDQALLFLSEKYDRHNART